MNKKGPFVKTGPPSVTGGASVAPVVPMERCRVHGSSGGRPRVVH